MNSVICPTCGQRQRCPYCNKLAPASSRYLPYCSYACKEYGSLNEARSYLQELAEKREAQP